MTASDVLFFDSIGMFQPLTSANIIEDRLNQMPPDQVKMIEMQLSNEVSAGMGVNYGSPYMNDLFSSASVGYNPVDAVSQNNSPQTTLSEAYTDFEYVMQVDTESTPVTGGNTPTGEKECADCEKKNNEPDGFLRGYRKGLGILAVIVIGSFLVGKAL